MHSEGILYGIDPFYRNRLGICTYQIIAFKEVHSVSNGFVAWIPMTSRDALSCGILSPETALDFIFIDGDHSWEGIRGDWEGFSNLIVEGGVVALHDSRNRDGCGSERFTKEVILMDPNFKVVETVDSLTVLQRI